MQVTAVSLAGITLNSIDLYKHDLTVLLKESAADLAVLPAYSALLLGLSLGELASAATFTTTVCDYLADKNGAWNKKFLALHSSLASDLNVYLACGTLFETEQEKSYHSAYCFDPAGNICCRQQQTHLTRAESDIGLSRGIVLNLFSVDKFQVGMVIGNDARHPEVGRIFGLRGADLLLHSGALEGSLNCWLQAAGMWAQVQQNQFWAAEAQLCGEISGCSFNTASNILGPCEITPGQSGYLKRGYPGTAVVTAKLDENIRHPLKESYPLLKLLNPEAYRVLADI
jgi:predicted amidohydrolase